LNGKAELVFANGNRYVGNFCAGNFCNFRDPEEGSCKLFLKDKITENPRNENSSKNPEDDNQKQIDSEY